MLAAETPGEQALAADLAALLEERDPLRESGTADIQSRLDAIAGRGAGDRGVLSRIRQAAGTYRARLGLRRDMPATGDPAALIAAGFPDRIALRRGEPGSFRLADGGGAKLDLADPLSRAPMLAVAAMGGRGAPKIGLATPLDPAIIETRLADRITTTNEVALEGTSGTIMLRERRRLGTIVLADRSAPATSADITHALQAAITAKPAILPWTDRTRQLQARAGWMHRLAPDTWPDLSDTTLATTLEDWLFPYLAGLTRLRDLQTLDLTTILRNHLGHDRMTTLDRALPEHLTLPTSTVTIDYTTPIPSAAARAQAFYGLDATPTLADGAVTLQIALLSPAQRPIAITANLASFWRTGWPDARKDMRGRYPRHEWPEEPWHAPAMGRRK
jgi:ATP-dependent helicase HrpB